MSASPTLPFHDETPRRVWAVSELVSDARWTLEDAYPKVWVRGELSNFRDVRGNWYFDLRDDDAVLNGVMFRSDNLRVPFRPQEGIDLVAAGRLSIFERGGRFQLIAAELEPVGRGAQQLAYEQLKRKLQAEGLFATERKRPLPQLPRCIGVVTSSEGAAWSDLLRVWKRRHTGLHVVLSPCRVQGEGAAAEIAAALRLLGRHGEAEVIIVGRGGGSREDLWPFNEEPVVRAIAAAEVPVISAVGHEIDWSLSDLVADARAATPTEAAELVARARLELLDRIDGAHRRCRVALHRRTATLRARLDHRDLHRRLSSPARALDAYRQRLDLAAARLAERGERACSTRRRRLDRAGERLARHAPDRLADAQRRRLERIGDRLRSSSIRHLHRGRERRGALAARLEALNPLAVLSRGFAICRDGKGRLVRDAAQVAAGDGVEVRLHTGELRCRVEEVEAGEAQSFVGPEERC